MIWIMGQKNPPKNFKFRKLLVWCHNLVKLVIKEKWMYSGYIAFGGRGLRSFGYDSFRNIVHLVLDNSSSFHPDRISFWC